MGAFKKWNPFVFATDILAAREAWNYQEQRNLLLSITMEEAGELIRACSKLMRHGDEEKHLINLQEEIADVQACIGLLVKRYSIPQEELVERTEMKTTKISKEITK